MRTSLLASSLVALGFALSACVVTNPDDEPSKDNGNSQNGDKPDADNSDGEGPLGSPARFFLPTGDHAANTTAPKIEIDKNGGIHSVYPAAFGGDAYYAYCPSNCESENDVSVIRIETSGTVANAMLALDAKGKPQVLLSTFSRVHYVSCEGDCSKPEAWKNTAIIEHGSDKEVTGNAFALDPQGRPRFLMHTYIAYRGIGQEPPKTEWVSCDDNCHEPTSWKLSTIGDQIFHESELRFDAKGRAHLVTVAQVEEGGKTQEIGAYQLCESDCGNPDSWTGPAFGEAYDDEMEAVSIRPAVSLALTREGHPRALFLGTDSAGKKQIIYLECNENCAEDATWSGIILTDHDKIGDGFDLALDANDHPRIVYTLDYNVGLAHCDGSSCTDENAQWGLTVVEKAEDMPADDIFLYPNCTVGAWLLHTPSIALTPSGLPRVGYQARDISGGWTTTDPTKPACTAGTDMTLSRLAIMPKL